MGQAGLTAESYRFLGRAHGAPFFDGDPNEHTNAIPIDRLERIGGEELLINMNPACLLWEAPGGFRLPSIPASPASPH